MQKLKFLILISALVFLSTLNLFAQTDSSGIDLKGKWALQFQISQNFTLSDFQGATFSGKYHFDNKSALRLGLTFRYNINERILSDNLPSPDTTTVKMEDRLTEDETFVELSIQYLQYSKIINSISMFYGCGIDYSTSLRNSKNYLEDKRTYYDYSYYGIGMSLHIGVEWFVNSNIGILAEYGTGLLYSSREVNYKQFYETTNDLDIKKESSTKFSFSPQNIKFGISVYF